MKYLFIHLSVEKSRGLCHQEVLRQGGLLTGMVLLQDPPVEESLVEEMLWSALVRLLKTFRNWI